MNLFSLCRALIASCIVLFSGCASMGQVTISLPTMTHEHTPGTPGNQTAWAVARTPADFYFSQSVTFHSGALEVL